MAKQKVFISFDYDHDEDIKILLVGQAKLPDSPFDFTDASVKEHLTGDWKEKVEKRMEKCDQIIFLCGTLTHTATGVATEMSIAQNIKKSYFLLNGRANETCYKPSTAKSTDKIYNWTWENLKALIGGSR